MSSGGPGAGQPGTTGEMGPAELRADIEQTREQLGETVEALVAKMDVKARARQQASATAARARNMIATLPARATRPASQLTSQQASRLSAGLAAAAVAMGLTGAWLLISRRRR
jgi:hypothetical protein